MKKLKKLLVLFTAALFCLLPILSQPLTAQASTPVTYYVKFDTEKNDWRYLVGSTWDDEAYDRELYYMNLDIKDGDIVIVDGTGILEIDVHLSNLTILNGDLAIVMVKSIDEFYALNNSKSSITGTIKNAYVYGDCLVNFNSDVSNLYVYDPTNPCADIGAGGTVEHAKVYDDDAVYYEFYNFEKASLSITDGTIMTDESKYSKTAPAATTTPAATTPATSTTTTPPAPADELDDVPKTGNFSVSPLWFLGIAMVCMLGYFKLERR